ncbi:hypothetical protein H9M94_02225 [Mycoplasma sp. Pen4]|uniref:MHO_1590 family protein n=1 Tax=Mycoplasma sp. Pen4 TaxID=640330 RepID=UPI001654418B|nr:hypothetical protein [Mycoplasma sp. Pen4]QNM93410.1 hypothetical protein H9M94_02225 [Mycoplasma sp. Pen4]
MVSETKKKKIKLLAIIASIIILCFSTFFLVSNTLSIQKSDNTTIIEREKLPSEKIKPKNDDIPKKIGTVFPILDHSYFEQFVKKDSSERKYLDDDIIKEILKDIVRRLKSYEGNLLFDYNKINDQHYILYMRYVNGANSEEKNYEIFLE